MNDRAAIIRALDSLELGDQRAATEILLGALEDGPTERRCRCDVCGLGLEWPGLLEEHHRNVHPVDEVTSRERIAA